VSIGLQSENKIYLLCAECPADFTYVPSVNGCYKASTSKRGWTDAGFECRSVHSDSHLVVINDAQEQSAVVLMLSSTDRQLYTFWCYLYTLSQKGYHTLSIVTKRRIIRF